MHEKRLVLTGNQVQTLTTHLHHSLEASRLLHRADRDVLFYESYYMRIGSNLMTTIVLDYEQPDRCAITIVSGGGTTGVFEIGWGAEQDAVEKIIALLHAITEQQQWKLQEIPLPNET